MIEKPGLDEGPVILGPFDEIDMLDIGLDYKWDRAAARQKTTLYHVFFLKPHSLRLDSLEGCYWQNAFSRLENCRNSWC